MTRFRAILGRCTVKLLVLVILLFGPIGAHARSPMQYRVGPGDQLRITAYGEPQLSGLFKLSADGCISYPLVGAVCVAGKTLDEVALLLRGRVLEFLPAGRNITVDIGQYSNVYVLGEVEKAGMQEYRPGMIVTELVALAGGFKRGTQEGADTMTRLLTVEQEVRDEKLQRFSGLVQRVRLRAEVSGTNFDPSPVAKGSEIPLEAVKRIIADETALYTSRQHALTEMRAALQRQSDAFDTEIETLNESVGLHESEIKLIQQEIDTQAGLVDKGVATATRLQSLRRELAGALRLSLDIRASLARAKQGQLEIAQKLADASDVRANENAANLRDLDVTLGRADQSIEAKLSIVDELRAQADRQPAPRTTTYVFSILRSIDGRYEAQAVTALDELKAGDILKVEVDPPKSGTTLKSLLLEN